MGAFLFHVGAAAMCPHGGQVSVTPTNSRVLVGGQPVAVIADQFPVAGCAFTVPPGDPRPCVNVQWLVPAARVLIGGQPAILQSSVGLCQSAEHIAQGPLTVTATQVRASGS